MIDTDNILLVSCLMTSFCDDDANNIILKTAKIFTCISASHQIGFDKMSLFIVGFFGREIGQEPKLLPCWTKLVTWLTFLKVNRMTLRGRRLTKCDVSLGTNACS